MIFLVECILGFSMVFILGNFVNGNMVFFMVIWFVCGFFNLNEGSVFFVIIFVVIFVIGMFVVFVMNGMVWFVLGLIFKI